MQRQLPNTEYCDQDENEFAGKHIAEQSQAQRKRLRDQCNEFQNEVEGNDKRRSNNSRALQWGRNRMQRQLTNKPPMPLFLIE